MLLSCALLLLVITTDFYAVVGFISNSSMVHKKALLTSCRAINYTYEKHSSLVFSYYCIGNITSSRARVIFPVEN